MTSQQRAEREAFFRDLDRLDELDKDEVAINAPRTTAQTRTEPVAATTNRRRQPHHDSNAPTLFPIPTAPEPTTTTAAQAVPRRKSSRINDPPALRRAQSDGAAGRVKKAGSKGTKKKPLPAIPAERQLFPGFGFFFIPNQDSPMVRALRIDFAEVHGATWIRDWNTSITHVLVEASLNFTELAKALPERALPRGIPVISDEWVSECYTRKTLLNVDQKRFLLKGMVSPFEVENKERQESDQNRQSADTVKTAKRAAFETPSKDVDRKGQTPIGNLSPTRHGPQPDESEVAKQADELGELIEKMQQTNYVALDDLVRNDPSFKFDDDFVLDPDELSSRNSKWQCMSKNERGHQTSNHNSATISLLEQMAAVYDRQDDNWRCQAFRKAAGALKQQTNWIRTKEEALALNNIGESIAEKIEEVASTGSFRRLENVRSDPVYRVVELFRGIYGVGIAQARAWVAAGYETLDQLLMSGDLTANQKIGIEHYEDFQIRIPRDEVTQHGLIIGQTLQAADAGLQFVIGGSYRRGSPDSGDIDVMITKEHAELGYLQSVIMDTVVHRLKRDGFIVAELATSQDKNSSKWMGASVVPGKKIWRRLDLLFVPWVERGAARLYWTGNDIFNRSCRLLASRKGMRLNQHGLFEDTMRGPGRVKITEGKRIAGESEKEIFEILGVPYRPPAQRNP